ncbi:hypothetical protein [Aquimarina longa]|uniref:hypothetical protein n=1 Tax=Aquimarina longa TaxID=1080221 RepID=UPI0007856B24|nr:hypothetical protein [Aquimarina longa]
MKKIIIFASFILATIACKKNSTNEKHIKKQENIEVRDSKYLVDNNKKKIRTTAEAIAHANGFQYWKKVTEIKFTFNIDKDTTHFEQSWSWKPKNDVVTLISEKDTITYNRTTIDSISIKTDQEFINDKFWLLAPFNLVWDASNFTSEHQVNAIAPISKTKMQKLTVVYKNKGGYTPGDAYDFYFEGDFIIKEWVYRKKNQLKPSISTTWEDYQDFSGIKIAKTHKVNQGNRTLYFTGIEIITQ